MMIDVSDPIELHLARDGAVTCKNYTELGYDRLARGVYGHLPADVDDYYDARRQLFLVRARALLAPYAGRDIVLYGPTALQALGVALPSHLEDWDQYHILVPDTGYRPLREDVVTHRCHSLGPVRVINGLPVLNPVDHWLQLADATDDELIEVGDGFVRLRHPLMTLDSINRRLAELSGARNVARVRRLVRWVAPGTESLYETRTRLPLIHGGLPAPRVNCPVYAPSGTVYHLDMGYELERVGVEYDGGVHVGDVRQMNIDATRRRDIQDAGWIIYTVTAEQLKNPAEFVRPVERSLAMRHASARR